MFPIIDVTGSAYERGRQHGLTARDRVERSIATYSKLLEACGITWGDAMRLSHEFRSVIEELAPDLLEEIRGIAEGAGRETDEILVLNARTELLPSPFPGDPPAEWLALAGKVDFGECTAVALQPSSSATGGTLMAQNLNWPGREPDTLIVLRARREDGSSYLTLTEAGVLAGTGFNDRGLGVSLNALQATEDDVTACIPARVLLRALLDCNDVADAIAHASKLRFGASATIVCADAGGARAALEITPGGVQVFDPPPPFDRIGKSPGENGDPIDLGDLERMLFNEANGHHAMSGHDEQDAPEIARTENVASVIMDLGARMMHVAPEPLGQGGYSSVALNHEMIAESDVDLIRESGKFDLEHYCRQVGENLSLDDAVEHYVREGENRHYSPSPDFDVAFYLASNPDIEKARVNAYAHYLRFGRGECRYGNKSALRADALKLLKSGHFDSEYYRRSNGKEDFTDTRPVEHYLLWGWRAGKCANPWFDDGFYFDAYPDVRQSGLVPLIHFIDIGMREQRRTRFEQIKDDVELIEASGSFDEDYYRSKHQLDDAEFEKLSPVVHFVLRGVRRWLDPGPQFCTEYYLRRYPDMNHPAINPLGHYLRHGKGEGRLAVPPSYRTIFKQAKGKYLESRPTLMLVLHECSQTGAPLLGLALLQELAQRYNMVVWAGRHGVLADDLESAAFLAGYNFPDPLDCEFVLRDLVANYPLDGVIANSVETSPLHRAILACNVPSVGLLHEFSAYTLPVGRLSTVISFLDRCVVPAELVRKSAVKEIESIWGGSPNNLVVQPQGHLPPELWSSKFSSKEDSDQYVQLYVAERLRGRKVVLGAGFIHIRKGVDLFIEVAHQVKEKRPNDPVHFLWIGDGYSPATDLLYSVWLKEALEKWGLEDTVTFLDGQKSIEWAFELADVFLLSSRLDPFPNVIVDAMAANVPVVCFDETTGCAEFMRKTGAAGAIVPYLDTRAAAEAILELIARRHHQNENARIVEQHMAMKNYVGLLEQELKVSQALVAERAEYCKEIDRTGWFDRAYYDSRWKIFPDSRGALREYVAHCMKGVFKLSPYPGFNDARYREKHMPAAAGEVIPLIHAIRNNTDIRPQTHECIVATGKPSSQRTVSSAGVRPLKIGLHAHLFYSEVIPEFVEMLRKTGISADLFVSCASDTQVEEIEYYLHDYRGWHSVRRVPNVGRDIGPFISEFARDLLAGGYDVVGHLHGKKSKVLGPGSGDAWRTYLWDNLLRGEGVWDTVYAAFAGDPQLGLLFAEDRHVVGWARNRAPAEELKQRLELSCDLPAIPVFPLGTMFWCRPQAIAPILESGLTWDDYPPEPLPYDGTILHALERLLPAVCEQFGYTWKTIYLQGTAW